MPARAGAWSKAGVVAPSSVCRRYDVLVASHVLEHVPDVLATLRHWLRVVRVGGVVLLFLPDPCSADAMDRVRLAAPATHHLDEWATTAPQEHAVEQALSFVRWHAMHSGGPAEKHRHERPGGIRRSG